VLAGERKAEGLTIRAIAERLNAEGVASPAVGAWQSGNVHRALSGRGRRNDSDLRVGGARLGSRQLGVARSPVIAWVCHDRYFAGAPTWATALYVTVIGTGLVCYQMTNLVSGQVARTGKLLADEMDRRRQDAVDRAAPD